MNPGCHGAFYGCTFKNSKYSAEEACTNNYSCAADGKACGTCINESKRCVVDDTTGIGHMEICVNGAFEYIEKDKNCDNDASCSADGLACGTCLNGAMRCVDDETTGIGHMEKCVNGEFEYVEKDKNCDHDNSCDTEANTCGECHNLDVICKNETRNNYKDSGVIYTCEKGKFNTGKECIDDKYVRASCNKEGTACGQCLNNVDTCIAANPSKIFACTDGELSPEKEVCPNGCMPFEARCAQ